jgi:hypothetical protein
MVGFTIETQAEVHLCCVNLLCDMKAETEVLLVYTVMILTGETEEGYSQ